MNYVVIVGVLVLMVIAAAWLGVMGTRRRPASWEVLERRLVPVDIDSFRNLIDPRQEQFLRMRLNRAQLRRVQRARRGATIHYLRCIAHNAAVLIQAGEAARSSPDAAVARSGAELVSTAISARLYSLAALARLYAGNIFPGVPLSCGDVLEIYEKLSRGLLRITPAMRLGA